MAKLSVEQLSRLGDSFLTLAQSTGDYRVANRAVLTKAENQKIKELHWNLLNYADDFYTTSARLVMEDVSDSLSRIRDITENINRSYRKLKSFQKAIDLAAAAVSLGASLFSKDPLAINNAILELEKKIKTK